MSILLVVGFRSVGCPSLYLNAATYSHVTNISLSCSSHQIILANIPAVYASPALEYKCFCFCCSKHVSALVEKLSFMTILCHFGRVFPNIHITLDHFPVTLDIFSHFGQCHKRPCFLLVLIHMAQKHKITPVQHIAVVLVASPFH